MNFLKHKHGVRKEDICYWKLNSDEVGLEVLLVDEK